MTPLADAGRDTESEPVGAGVVASGHALPSAFDAVRDRLSEPATTPPKIVTRSVVWME